MRQYHWFLWCSTDRCSVFLSTLNSVGAKRVKNRWKASFLTRSRCVCIRVQTANDSLVFVGREYLRCGTLPAPMGRPQRTRRPGSPMRLDRSAGFRRRRRRAPTAGTCREREHAGVAGAVPAPSGQRVRVRAGPICLRRAVPAKPGAQEGWHFQAGVLADCVAGRRSGSCPTENAPGTAAGASAGIVGQASPGSLKRTSEPPRLKGDHRNRGRTCRGQTSEACLPNLPVPSQPGPR